MGGVRFSVFATPAASRYLRSQVSVVGAGLRNFQVVPPGHQPMYDMAAGRVPGRSGWEPLAPVSLQCGRFALDEGRLAEKRRIADEQRSHELEAGLRKSAYEIPVLIR
jgi:hypothetical protein